MQNQTEAHASAEHQVAQLEIIAKKYLDKDALVRFGTIKAADPEKATQVALVLAQLIQSSRIRGQISDAQFKGILAQMAPKQRDIRITRK